MDRQVVTVAREAGEGPRGAGKYDFGDLPQGQGGGGPLELPGGDGGAKLTWDSDWWGFTIYLNREAVAVLRDDASKIVGPIVALLPPPVDVIVGLYLAARASWAVLVAGDGGVKFHSLWIMPGLLTPSAWDDGETPVPPPPPPKTEDTYLYASCFEPGKGWGEQVRFTDQQSYSAPSLQLDMNANVVDCVYRGGKDDETLYHLVKNQLEGGEWVTAKALSASSSLAVAFDRTATNNVVVHRGGGSDSSLRMVFGKMAGGDFNDDDSPLPGCTTDGRPGLFSEHIVFRGSGPDEQLYYYRFGAGGNPEPQKIEDAKSASGAALDYLDDAYVCVFRGQKGDEQLYWMTGHTSVSGMTWGAPQKVPGASSAATPALGSSTGFMEYGKMPLLCVYRGPGSDEKLYWAVLKKDQSGNFVWTDSAPVGEVESADGVGLTGDTYYANGEWHSQILCVHRGHGLR
ncbi:MULTISPECIES: hypothetical protein [unclassified Streptomyces]|uniref:hypothetical protein n=1 Tax=unclassified Streptomyces TaxID=2593676 RepID=UPI00380865AE